MEHVDSPSYLQTSTYCRNMCLLIFIYLHTCHHDFSSCFLEFPGNSRDNYSASCIPVWAPIASVGWYIVGLGIIALYMFPHIQEKYKNWKARNQRDGVAFGKSE